MRYSLCAKPPEQDMNNVTLNFIGQHVMKAKHYPLVNEIEKLIYVQVGVCL